jgi:hypothetical protein
MLSRRPPRAIAWSNVLVSAAVLVAFILNIAPATPPGFTNTEMNTMVDDVYRELGLPHGRLQARLGLAAFGLFSLASYILLFGEVCSNSSGACKPIFQTLLQ